MERTVETGSSEMFRTAAVAAFAFTLLAVATPVQAADPDGSVLPVRAAAIDLDSDTDWSLAPVPLPDDRTATRGAVLPSLYVSLAALNLYDGYSTGVGLRRGAVEANGALKGFAGNAVARYTVKVGATALSIYMAERLWKKGQRAQAIALMVVSNGMMTAVAARNASVLRQLR